MESQAPAARRYQMVARAEAAEATGERILAAARTLFGHLPYDQVLAQRGGAFGQRHGSDGGPPLRLQGAAVR